jgi:hypothetical protein
VVIEARDAAFDTTLREIVTATPVANELQNRRMEDYRKKVLETFFRAGRLEKLPAQHKKRHIVLEQFAARFELEHRYSEQEVTELIMPLFADYCTVRRLLVDEGLIRREGTKYWREPKSGNSASGPELPAKKGMGPGKMQNKTKRAEIKRTFKQNSPEMGVYQICNLVNGRIYVAASRNLEGERNSRLFQLRMGKIVFSRELQQDLQQYGAENFTVSVLSVLEPPEAGTDVEKALAALELKWLEKLQPFGERGYNNAQAYQRNLERLKNLG